MKEVGVLLSKQYKLLSIAAILEVFETVNKLHTNEGAPAPFHITLLTPDESSAGNVFPGYYAEYMSAAGKKDLILIPAFTTDNVQQAIQENMPCISWLVQQFREGAEIATVCTGAFLLGATGLLNGKIATTHVDASKAFAMAFPEVKLKDDKTVTQDGGLYTSGGATSSFHLLLHLIQKYCSKEVAIRTAKIFAIDMDRHQQTYFSTFQPMKNHNDELVASAQKKIETSFQDSATIEEMIKDIPASRRNMVRRFKQVTGITPIEYLQMTRIEAAKKLLLQTGQQMTEIILNTGYNDPKAFRKIFRKNVGMTPTEYREKFQVI